MGVPYEHSALAGGVLQVWCSCWPPESRTPVQSILQRRQAGHPAFTHIACMTASYAPWYEPPFRFITQ